MKLWTAFGAVEGLIRTELCLYFLKRINATTLGQSPLFCFLSSYRDSTVSCSVRKKCFHSLFLPFCSVRMLKDPPQPTETQLPGSPVPPHPLLFLHIFLSATTSLTSQFGLAHHAEQCATSAHLLNIVHCTTAPPPPHQLQIQQAVNPTVKWRWIILSPANWFVS